LRDVHGLVGNASCPISLRKLVLKLLTQILWT